MKRDSTWPRTDYSANRRMVDNRAGNAQEIPDFSDRAAWPVQFLETSNDIAWTWDIAAGPLVLSERCRKVLHIASRYAGFQQFSELVLPEDRCHIEHALVSCLAGSRNLFTCQFRLVTPAGLKWVLMKGKSMFAPSGEVVCLIGSLTDITRSKVQEEAIRYLTYFDVVTGLPNRASMQEAVELVLQRGGAGTLVVFDVDKLQVINDMAEASFRDKILFLVADMLREKVPAKHFLAKAGDNQFMIFVEGVIDQQIVWEYACHLLEFFEEPLRMGDRSIKLSVSIGTASLPEDGATIEILLNHAELALYRAKLLRNSRIVCFEQTMAEEALRKLMMEEALRDAVKNDELVLFYQPIIECSGKKVVGFEALLRWNSRQYGFVAPDGFVRLAEETGLIIPIGEWVVRQACRFLARLQQGGFAGLLVSVNLSIVQLLQGDFVENILQAIQGAGIQSKQIAFEITESLLMETFEISGEKLQHLRQEGIKIYLDDFGTGYSSLKYLQKLPVDMVKIDKSFTDELLKADQSVLVGAMMEMVHRLGLKIVAEGVETEQQLDKLLGFGCDNMQGYLISKPMPEKDVIPFLQRYICPGCGK